VPQPLPADAAEHAPATLRDLRLLDPACGSGHFLVIALELLFHPYQEEARHRRERWSDAQIVEWILERNLHGVDIDPWATQIAAAAVWLQARKLAPEARPRRRPTPSACPAAPCGATTLHPAASWSTS